MAKIFLSWSGSVGKKIATLLRELLPEILRIPTPFMSDIDIEKGRQWREELDDRLRETNYGMFILTPENKANVSEWMAYEAGAVISNRDREIRVLTLLFGVQATSMPKYLLEYQFSDFKEEDWKKLLRDIRNAMEQNPEESGIVLQSFGNFDISFRLFWREFESRVQIILSEVESAHPDSSNSRSDRELEATVESLQELSSFVVRIPSIETKINDLFSQFDSFQSRLVPALRETGLLTSPSGSDERNRPRTSSMSRLKNVVALIEKEGLLDDGTLQDLKSALEDLG